MPIKIGDEVQIKWDEAGKDGSEGRNGKHGDDFALSGG
jgi:hypothetical protein